MTDRRLRAALFAGGLLLVAALPVLGRSLRSGGADRCAMDGVVVAGRARVRVADADGRERIFCCVECAGRWTVARGSAARSVLVTDDVSGGTVAAGDAWFVRSRIPVAGAPGSRVHCFAAEADALRHARDFGGVVLEGPARPFHGREGGDR